MRQAQHGRKQRGRGRKPGNSLSRIYDSNGPDAKIRGTAAHIAEKYQSLSRDASSSGDRVAAENYLQHAEHYLRIVAAAQAQAQPQMGDQPGFADRQGGQERRDSDDEDEDEAPARQPWPQRAERAERAERPERAERAERPERAERAENGNDQGDEAGRQPQQGRGRRGARRRPGSEQGEAQTRQDDRQDETPVAAGANGADRPAAAAAPDTDEPAAAPPRRRGRRPAKTADAEAPDPSPVDAV
jgi:hypothetical protein